MRRSTLLRSGPTLHRSRAEALRDTLQDYVAGLLTAQPEIEPADVAKIAVETSDRFSQLLRQRGLTRE